MLKRFLVFGLLALLALFVFLQSRSSTYRVERSVQIAAPQRAAFDALDDLQQWPRWSPWEELDPQLKRTYGGPTSGRGATFAWDGNAQVGKGRITIVDSVLPRSVTYRVSFEAPLEVEMKYEFQVAQVGEGSKVSWVFEGGHPFWAKLFTLFTDLDQQLGSDMQRGLTQLKANLEKH